MLHVKCITLILYTTWTMIYRCFLYVLRCEENITLYNKINCTQLDHSDYHYYFFFKKSLSTKCNIA